MPKKSKKTEVVTKLDRIKDLFLRNPDKVWSKEELAAKVFSTDDLKTSRVIASGYIPIVRVELEENHNKTLRNFRGKGWKLAENGYDNYYASLSSEKMMFGHAKSYKRKINTIDINKLSETIKDLVKKRDLVVNTVNSMMLMVLEWDNAIQRAIPQDIRKIKELPLFKEIKEKQEEEAKV